MIDKSGNIFNFMSEYVSTGDIDAAKAIAEASAFIIKKRHALNLSQKEFAEMMGVSQGMVSKWESAGYDFSIEELSHIAEKLGMRFSVNFEKM